MAKKTALVIDESDLFREYLRSRLAEHGIEVEVAVNGLDGIVKMRNSLPDVVLLDYHLTRKTCKELLEEKNRNPNTAAIPVILTAQKIDKNRLLELVPFNIKKVFMKPIKMDSLYGTLSELLGVRFAMDETPCIIEAHVNDNIVFIEIAKGLNREKIDLLRFKIAELLELYAIRNPRILIMITDMELSFVDGSNLELLLSTVLEHSRTKAKHVKVLTNEAFVREFARGRPEFSEIEVLSNLQYAMDGLIADYDRDGDGGESKAEVISERILSAQSLRSGGESIEMRFDAEGRKAYSLEAIKEAGHGLSIAVVDDDFVIQELVKTTFAAISADVTPYSNGREFLDALKGKSFDLVFLDILMPELDGFGVLQRLHAEDIDVPVIVLSAVSQREAVVRAFQAGVKSYLIKPLKPDQILKKTLEILKANF
ncbi:MAG TPA: response regulator [Spirochaetales bacterium]|nr:response regulator [Spirochaetales bacterium]